MFFDGNITINVNSPSREEQKLFAMKRHIPLYIPAGQKRPDDFFAFGIFRDQPFPGGGIDDKGFVQTGFDSIIYFPLDIFAQGATGLAEFIQQALAILIGQGPAGVVQGGLPHGMVMFGHIIRQAAKIQGPNRNRPESLGRCFALDHQNARIGGGLFKNRQITKVHHLNDVTRFHPLAQGFAVVGPKPFIGHDIGKKSIGP